MNQATVADKRMRVRRSSVEKLCITDAPKLDPVNVFLEDFGEGRGKLTVECYGEAWSAYFGSMGCSLVDFVRSCEPDYIARKFGRTDPYTTDWDKISRDLTKANGEEVVVTNEVELAYVHKMTEAAYGPDWYMDMPQKECPKHAYVCRIVDAVKTALGMIDNQEEERIDLIVQALFAAVEQHEKNLFYSQHHGYIVEVERKSTAEDWYIQVRPCDGGFLYDGWWNDSHQKSLRQAVFEAVRGACLTDLIRRPAPDEHGTG